MATIACCIERLISSDFRMTRLLFEVSSPRNWPLRSYSTELRARWNSARFSMSGRSAATAIIIPNAVDSSAMSERPATMSMSRSFLRRGRGRTAPVLALSAMAAPAPDAEFLARNAVDCLPSGELERKLAQGRPLRVKFGMDPTAPDLHLGHTVVLQKLREFQDRGHTAVLIVGDYTARVGDPSGRSATRPVLSPEEIDANARTYVEQAAKVLRTDDEAFELRFNSEWLDMPMEDLFRLVRVPTVAQLLERDDFAKRMAASEPVSLLELLYPVLQGYDSVAVRSDIELGGTDQTFNLLMGRSIQGAYGQPQQVVLTVPLLVGTDGVEKMSKSVGNHVGVTDP